MKLEVKRNERGTWCVYIDGHMISDHASHAAARIASQRHYIEARRLAELDANA